MTGLFLLSYRAIESFTNCSLGLTSLGNRLKKKWWRLWLRVLQTATFKLHLPITPTIYLNKICGKKTEDIVKLETRGLGHSLLLQLFVSWSIVFWFVLFLIQAYFSGPTFSWLDQFGYTYKHFRFQYVSYLFNMNLWSIITICGHRNKACGPSYNFIH